MSEQKSTKKHADTSKAPRTAPTMASMAAAIHAAKVRSSEKTADKTTENNAVKNGAPKKDAQKNSAQKNNADRKNSSRGISERNSNASRSNRRAGGTNRARKQGNQQGDNKSSQQNRPAPRRYEPLIPEAITYPEELPVSERREDIMNAIRDNQVVIIAGETGSGKTTQIPKMCLDLGLGEKGLIGHTQPRRLAARSVAERIAEELGQKIGETVGYQVRFTSEVGEHSAIKL
ncbi:MAG: ATP-dependent helicase, partial [Rothia mucilaginosa]|nr:ATP-dependent helicase [Rothia mucilaginosa]